MTAKAGRGVDAAESDNESGVIVVVGKFERNKDTVQEMTESAANHVGKIAVIIAGAVTGFRTESKCARQRRRQVRTGLSVKSSTASSRTADVREPLTFDFCGSRSRRNHTSYRGPPVVRRVALGFVRGEGLRFKQT